MLGESEWEEGRVKTSLWRQKWQRGERQAEKQKERRRDGRWVTLSFKGNTADMHRECSWSLQLRVYPARTPRTGQ